jgi:hypothetical protein
LRLAAPRRRSPPARPHVSCADNRRIFLERRAKGANISSRLRVRGRSCMIRHACCGAAFRADDPSAKPLKQEESLCAMNNLISKWGLSRIIVYQWVKRAQSCSFWTFPEITGGTGKTGAPEALPRAVAHGTRGRFANATLAGRTPQPGRVEGDANGRTDASLRALRAPGIGAGTPVLSVLPKQNISAYIQHAKQPAVLRMAAAAAGQSGVIGVKSGPACAFYVTVVASRVPRIGGRVSARCPRRST